MRTSSSCKKIPGCENVEKECVDEWTAVDDKGFEEYTDEDIVAQVQGFPADDSCSSEDEGDAQTTDNVPHSAAASAFDLALRYVEQHAAATPNDISQFLTTLDQDLLRGVGSSLASLLGQCMYFGLSLSRVGADFRALVAPVFVRAVKRNLETSVRKASKKFEADMDKFTLPKSQPQVKTGTPTQKSGIKQEQTPESLLEFYPLAEYCNNLLVGLNELRLCAPLACAAHAATLLQDSLTTAARVILAFYRQHPAKTQLKTCLNPPE
ncbi:conserved oligomeric Golgi complex component [Homalodisca vitripennis]|nr:conserved oligomeric Golgi complex component [Homalodisca vitripennis]